LGCVRCHDHKFDAIGQQDYYALAGMFRSTKTTFKTGHGIWSNIQRVPLPKLEEDQVAARSHEQKLAGWRNEKQKLEAESKALGDKPDAAGKKRLDELKKELTALELRIGHGEYFHPGKPQAIAVQDTEKPTAGVEVLVRNKGRVLKPCQVEGELFPHNYKDGVPPDHTRYLDYEVPLALLEKCENRFTFTVLQGKLAVVERLELAVFRKGKSNVRTD
jgi:hypothetical protein